MSQNIILLNIVGGSFVGSGIVTILIEVAKHLFSKRLYSFKLNLKDVVGYRDEILDIIKTENAYELGIVNSKEHLKSQAIYDRLHTLKKDKLKKVFWDYVNSCIKYNPILHQLSNPPEAISSQGMVTDLNSFIEVAEDRNKKRNKVLDVCRNL